MQITFDDDKTLADFKMVALKGYEKSLMPSISGNTTAIPGKAGAWDHGDELGVMKDKYPIACLEQDPIKREQCFNDFIAYTTNQYRKPRLMKMSFSTEPDKFIYGKVSKSIMPKRYNSGGDFDLDIINNEGTRFALSDAYDPEYVPEYDHVKNGDMYENSQRLDWIYRNSYSGFHNYSMYITSVKFVIRGTIKNASIIHQQTNTELTIPDMTNGMMIVDTKTMSITLNGTGLMTGTNHEFFEINPGNNSFLFKSDKPNAVVEFHWLHEF